MTSAASFLELADRIGAAICRDAIWDGSRCNWVAGYVAGAGNEGVDYQALDPSLYRGTSGIAVFLSRLATATGEKIFLDTARGALRQALSQRDRLPASGGFYSGLAGVAYALIQCGEPFFVEGMNLGQAVLTLPSDRNYDLIAGRAGLLVAALHFYRAGGGGVFLQGALEHGEILLHAARHSDDGWSWPTLTEGTPPERPDLNGFGHGVAGIAWPLLELWHATGEQKYRTAADEGFRYEQSCFNAEHSNWPDFRWWTPDSPEPRYSEMWCNGSGGIAFSRLRAAQLTGERGYQDQAKAALESVQRGLQRWGSCCICHGLFGSIDLLLYAGATEGIALAHNAAQDAIDRYPAKRLPWPCGVPDGHETPDLMLGLAGIGHTLLRLADPSAFPSPLIVACD